MNTDAWIHTRAIQCAPMTTEGQTDVQKSPVRGELIRQLRDQMHDGDGMPRHKFAAAADISPSTLQRAEASDPGTTLPVLSRIARVLDVPLSTIYEGMIVHDPAPAEGPPPAWFTQFVEQLDARLSAIESNQAEILRATRNRTKR